MGLYLNGQKIIDGVFQGGSVTLPSIRFANSLKDGFYRIGSNNIGLSLDGVKAWDFGILSTTAASPLSFTTGAAITAGNYQIGRNADATNQMHFNVPTGAGWEFSVNDVATATLNGAGLFALPVSGSSIEAGATNKLKFSGDYAGSGLIPAGAYGGSTAGSFSVLAGTGVPSTSKLILMYYSPSSWRSAVEVANVASGLGTLKLMDAGGSITSSANWTLTGVASTSGLPKILSITPPNNTGTTASTNNPQFSFGVSTQTYAAGAMTSVSYFSIGSPTYAFDGASTVTNAYNLYVDIPITGPNATLSNIWSIGAAGGIRSGAKIYAVSQIVAGNGGVNLDTGTLFGIATQGRIYAANTFSLLLGGQPTDGASAVGAYIGSSTALSTTGSKLLSVMNSSTEKAYIDYTGGYVTQGTNQDKQGTDIASASTIVIPKDGNIHELTGTTAVNLITTTGFQEGTIITLIANENVTINHGTATSGADVTIKLAGAGNFAMTADDTLTLVLSSTTAGGQAWREKCRAAI